MGGNALKQVGVDVVRLPAGLYNELAANVKRMLDGCPELPGLRAEVIPSLRSKADFGDLDVLVANDRQPNWGLSEPVKTSLAAMFTPTHVVQNGSVLSLDVAVPSMSKRFQLDLIRVPPDVFEFALGYFSYNDLGNLLGRVARLYGFKLGHEGLFRPLRAPGNESHFVRDILVTRDWPEALEFLGYDSKRWKRGFDTLEDMFEFVTCSGAFHPSVFPLENRSHRARVRDRKRPTCGAFLQWLEVNGLMHAEELGEQARAALARLALIRALGQFEEFYREWGHAQADLHNALMFRRRFNGEVVRQITGLDGPALGAYMASLRRKFTTEEAFRAFVLCQSAAALEEFIRHGTLPSL